MGQGQNQGKGKGQGQGQGNGKNQGGSDWWDKQTLDDHSKWDERINLTNEWQKVSVTFTVTEKMLSEENRVNYLGWEQTTNSESGKLVR